jgi:FkbM family methyltransferase
MSIESSLKESTTDEKILAHFNTDFPHFAYCMGGLRKLSVNPHDARARKMLLAKGPKCFTRNQALIHAFTKNLSIDLFLDIGTNYGETLVSSPLFSKVRRVGFEPNPTLIPYLEKTLRMNDDLEDIEIVNKAVSSVAGETIEFYVSRKWSGKSSAVSGVGAGKTDKIEVETTTIDEQISLTGPVTFLLIKLDVEGYEPAVIRGAQKTHQTVSNILYLMEFDARFIRKGGEDPRAFFTVSDGHAPLICPVPDA